jgi:hypothetical protein
MRQLLSFAVPVCSLALLTGSASACINDREVQNAEREFKSNYLETAPSPVSPGESAPADSSSTLAVAAGTILLAGAITLGITRSDHRKRGS